MRDSTRDYTIAQFRLYASLGYPSKAQVVADKTMHRALQLDLLAVVDTLNALTNSGKDYICQAVSAVIPFRPLTDISEFLFCKYDFLGESVKQIAKDYERNPSQVRQVIQTAKANGNYQKHIDKYKAMVGR